MKKIDRKILNNIILKNRNLGHVPAYVKKFISVNENLWKEDTNKCHVGSVIVEGLTGEMPTHLVRIGISSVAIRDAVGLNPVIVLKARNCKLERESFGSFGINRYEYLDEVKISIGGIIGIVVAMTHFYTRKNVGNLLELNYKGVNIGGLIYDDLIMSDEKRYTISELRKHDLKRVWDALLLVEKYRRIIKKNKAQAVLTAHNAYINYGTLGVAAIVEKKIGFTVWDLEASYFKDPVELCFMERHNRDIREIMASVDNEVLAKEGERYFKERENPSGGALYDAKYAYKDKTIYTRQRLKNEFSHNDKKNAIIFMHVFSDSPHTSTMNVHKDYYDWFVDTLEQAKSIKTVNWYIKVHPSAFVYNEKIMLENYCRKDDGIYLLPDSFSTASVWDSCDAVITCQGTIGIEAACRGIPTIASGRPFYDGFNIIYCARSKDEYHELLRKCAELKPMNPEIIKRALAVMGAHHRAVYYDGSILDEEVYEFGGYGKLRDYQKAFEKIISNIDGIGGREIPLYRKVYELTSKEYKGEGA